MRRHPDEDMKLKLTTLALFLPIAAAAGLSIPFDETDSITAEFSGPVTSDSAAEFDALLRRASSRTVFLSLDSPGGEWSTALRIGEMLSRHCYGASRLDMRQRLRIATGSRASTFGGGQSGDSPPILCSIRPPFAP